MLAVATPNTTASQANAASCGTIVGAVAGDGRTSGNCRRAAGPVGWAGCARGAGTAARAWRRRRAGCVRALSALGATRGRAVTNSELIDAGCTSANRADRRRLRGLVIAHCLGNCNAQLGTRARLAAAAGEALRPAPASATAGAPLGIQLPRAATAEAAPLPRPARATVHWPAGQNKQFLERKLSVNVECVSVVAVRSANASL